MEKSILSFKKCSRITKWSLFRSLEKSPVEKGQNPQVKESTAPRDAPSAAPDSPASREPWMCLDRMLSSCADVLSALEIAILGSRGEKKSFYQSHRKHCHGSVGWAGFCPKSLACLKNRAGKNKEKGSAAQPDQLLEVKAKSFMGKGSGSFIRGGGERAFPQNYEKHLPALPGAGCWALQQHQWLSAVGAGKDSA